MADHGEGDDHTLEALVSAGLIALVRADVGLSVIDTAGAAARGIVPGRQLCDQIPALVGLEDQLESLKAYPGRRIEMANVSLVARDEVPARQDISVIFDHSARRFITAIMPSLANNALAIEREQSLRQRYLLETQIADQTRAVMAANEALHQINADLLDFTRIVSHDLKAPMRAMRYFADDIEQAIENSDTAGQLAAIDDLRFQTTRLSRLVSDLLTYTRLDDKSEAEAEVDTRRLIDTVIATLPRPDGIAVRVKGDWPVLTTTAPLLDLVLRNLIDNAIKHHDLDVGVIDVVSDVGEAEMQLVVADDGPGIPARHRSSVLAPFAKLSGDRDAGSGLGLAMIDKILKARGGGIEIGPRLDGRRGARIVVTWPLTMQSK